MFNCMWPWTGCSRRLVTEVEYILSNLYFITFCIASTREKIWFPAGVTVCLELAHFFCVYVDFIWVLRYPPSFQRSVCYANCVNYLCIIWINKREGACVCARACKVSLYVARSDRYQEPINTVVRIDCTCMPVTFRKYHLLLRGPEVSTNWLLETDGSVFGSKLDFVSTARHKKL